MGMCFGVRNALEKVWALGYASDTALYGELVHNAEVNQRLAERGIQVLDEVTRSPRVARPRVILTAHGVSDRERRALLDQGKTLLDTTCPLVRRAHQAALALAKAGYFIVVVGKKDHVEVKGLVGDLALYAFVEDPSEVETYPFDRVAVISQTTTSPSAMEAVWARVMRRNLGKDLRFVDTLCRATRERQKAVLDLLNEGVQALVVVGGRKSNNTTRLAALAESERVPAYLVESASELDPTWFKGLSLVGLTAGTSTLDTTIDAVERALRAMEDTAAIRRVS